MILRLVVLTVALQLPVISLSGKIACFASYIRMHSSLKYTFHPPSDGKISISFGAE